MGCLRGLVVDTMVTLVTVFRRPASPDACQRMEDAMPFPRPNEATLSQATLAAIAHEPRISSDSHMTEPLDLWEKHLPPALRDRAPRFPQRTRDPATGQVRAGGWDP